MGQGQPINFFFPLRVASFSVGPRGDSVYRLQTYRTFLRNCEDGVISNDDRHAASAITAVARVNCPRFDTEYTIKL